MGNVSTCLWFDGQAEEAAKFYTSVVKNSRVGDIVPYGEAGPGEKGSVMIVMFELDGQKFIGLNGGPQFKFDEAISTRSRRSTSCRSSSPLMAVSRVHAGG